MAVKIKNSLTNKKEEFVPLNPPEVKMYTCGVTVYDHCHIGHARSLYIFEVIRRYLEYRQFKVKFVRNITDVDDKIINKAREWVKQKDISLKAAFDEVKEYYIRDYYKDLETLGLPKADIEPCATENISQMQDYINALIKKEFAYEREGNVYFSVRKLSSYGALSGKKIDDLLSSVRIESEPLKEDPLDFALWKKAKADEPSWDSPWGKGRPGWHIECSVMSQKYLETDTLDIHGGGRDLIFPHHENERAQAEAETGKQFARYWIHHGLLTINGQKMAKSLGNFVTIRDFMDKHKDADLLKLFFLGAHYSHPIDFNDDKIIEVKKQKKSFYDFFDRIDNREVIKQGKKASKCSDFAKDKVKIDDICRNFEQAMDDDFSTSRALACLFELIDLGAGFTSSDNEEAFQYIDDKIEIFFYIFALKRKETKPIPEELRKKARERNQARENKDFKKADQIRAEMESRFPYVIADSANATAFISKFLPEEEADGRAE